MQELKTEQLMALLSSTKLWTILASAMAVHAFVQQFLYTISPLLTFISNLLRRLFRHSHSYFSFDIPEFEGSTVNALYSDVHLYLSTLTPLSSTTTRLTLTRSSKSSVLTTSLSDGDRLADTFNGVTVSWRHSAATKQQLEGNKTAQTNDGSSNTYTLRTNTDDMHLILPDYFTLITDRAAELRHVDRQRLLYTNAHDYMYGRSKLWASVPLKHPSTFDTLALEPSLKEEIMADLREFADNGGEFYQRTGRAWKRGYLLYGPPGTGKSSMIAAMANYLSYDIYDLELTKVKSNSDLLSLLMQTTSKSIIVIEDIDCSVDLRKREKKTEPPPPYDDYRHSKLSITLSGLLNFTDGLWSSCGSEKIFVFTTNHIENIDPALLRSGRMDLHVEMGYCSFPAMKTLMKNYWGTEEVDGCEVLMEEMEEVTEAAEITPADVSEVLTRNRRKDKEKAVQELLAVLKKRADLKSMRGQDLPEIFKEHAELKTEIGEDSLKVFKENAELKSEIEEKQLEVLKNRAELKSKRAKDLLEELKECTDVKIKKGEELLEVSKEGMKLKSEIREELMEVVKEHAELKSETGAELIELLYVVKKSGELKSKKKRNY